MDIVLEIRYLNILGKHRLFVLGIENKKPGANSIVGTGQ